MTEEKRERISSSGSKPEVDHQSITSPTATGDEALEKQREISAKAENPLAGLQQDELTQMVADYCTQHGFDSEEDLRVFRLGALIAGNDFHWDTISGLTDAEIAGLELERDHKYKSLPKTLVGVVVVCVSVSLSLSLSGRLHLDDPNTSCLQALCAAVQGMDETVVNGAQSFYKKQFGIGDSSSQRDSWLLGLLNSAPYLCCAFIGCWLTEPMNARFGRRGTVFVACVISALACFWQAFTSESPSIKHSSLDLGS